MYWYMGVCACELVLFVCMLYYVCRANVFFHLHRYKNEHGDCCVQVHSKEYPQLGQWVARQRKQYSARQMSKNRLKKLQKIGFTF